MKGPLFKFMYSLEIKTKPSPDQLFRLAAIGVCIAKDQGKLKESTQADNAHIFLSADAEVIEVHNEEEYLRSTHKFIGRIAKIGYKRWSMRIAEPYWISASDGDDGYRATYSFEWTNKETVYARKHMHARGAWEGVLISGLLPERIDEIMYEADFLHAVNEFETVSGADCGELVRAMDDFSRKPRFSVIEYNR